jgi:hypothetical protein
MSRRWLGDKLKMGYETAVSRAVSFVESSNEVALMKMKGKLIKTNE